MERVHKVPKRRWEIRFNTEDNGYVFVFSFGKRRKKAIISARTALRKHIPGIKFLNPPEVKRLRGTCVRDIWCGSIVNLDPAVLGSKS